MTRRICLLQRPLTQVCGVLPPNACESCGRRRRSGASTNRAGAASPLSRGPYGAHERFALDLSLCPSPNVWRVLQERRLVPRPVAASRNAAGAASPLSRGPCGTHERFALVLFLCPSPNCGALWRGPPLVRRPLAHGSQSDLPE
jgi:hypothetical protein